MFPTPAEVARTLTAGRLPGWAQVPGHPDPLPVRHAVDEEGHPLLLVAEDSRLGEALTPDPGWEDVPVALAVDDIPPLPGSPSYGRIWVAGWVRRLVAAEQRAAALVFADTNPHGDLLDLGRGFALYRMEPAEVRVEHCGHVRQVELADYLSATPDPLHPEERDLLLDLIEHHPDTCERMACRIRERVAKVMSASPVRLDRYGFLFSVRTPDEQLWIRLGFPRRLERREELAAVIRPLLGCRCFQ